MFISLFTFNACKTDEVIPNNDGNIETNEVIIKENEAFAAIIPTATVSTFLTGKISDEQGNALNGVK